MRSIVRVSAPARLHLGFLDLNGSSGRKFGSIGLAIDSHNTVIEAKLSSSTVINGDDAVSAKYCQRITSIVEQFYSTLGQHIPAKQQAVALSLINVIPSHAGLGSGTQLALAVGTALCKLHQVSASTRDIAFQLDRGKRSGIGIATFDLGGFIVDGGLKNDATTPPLLGHYQFPENWRIVTIINPASQGVHGEDELKAFKDLPIFPLTNSQAICHLTLMKLLPALVEQDIDSFGEAITSIQFLIGDHFAPAQGGRYTSPQVASLLNHSQNLGHKGIAQSSWGPTGCIFVENESSAVQLIEELKQHAQTHFDEESSLSFIIAQANSSGANIEITTS